MKLSLGFVLVALLGLAQAVPLAVSEVQKKASEGLRLIQLQENVEPVWKTEDEKLELMRNKVKFFDVTETYELEQSLSKLQSFAPAATFPAPSHQTAVQALLPKLSIDSMTAYLTKLTSFNNRYYKASTGQSASAYIQDTLKSIASGAGRSDVTVSAFSHSWVQTSTIARIEGTGSSKAITVLGAHMDSINLSNPTSGRAPGADDDGTGTVNLMEAFRVLVESGFKPSSPVEFHFYAGEEAGLLGSNAIAANYKSAGKSVKAMLELDMTGFIKPGTSEVVGLMPDYTDSGLTTFTKQIIAAYTKLKAVTNNPCGYACSDHASWYKQGYPTALPFEGTYEGENPAAHTSGDTTSVNGFSWTHSLEYAKIAVGFAYELAA